MKRIKYIVLFLLLMFPFFVNAETLTYNVCQNGCEYTELNDVLLELNNKTFNHEYNNTDIIINLLDDSTYSLQNVAQYSIYGGTSNPSQEYVNINSFTLNGMGNELHNISIIIAAKNITINNIKSPVLDNENHFFLDGIMDEEKMIHFTEEGRELAELTLSKHNYLKSFLMRAGIDDETAEREACAMEHGLSQESFEKIRQFYPIMLETD